jgi:hypothetical protein
MFAALHGTLGSYGRDTLEEGNDDYLACFPVPRAHVFPSFCLVAYATFSSRSFFSKYGHKIAKYMYR